MVRGSIRSNAPGVGNGTKAFEYRVRGLELECRGAAVALARVGVGEQHADACRLVGNDRQAARTAAPLVAT